MANNKIMVTDKELQILSYLLNCVDNCLSYDKDYKEYTDAGNFLCNLTKEEYKTFKKLYEKI